MTSARLWDGVYQPLQVICLSTCYCFCRDWAWEPGTVFYFQVSANCTSCSPRLGPPNQTHLPRLETSSADKKLISGLVRHTLGATVVFSSHIIRQKENCLSLLIFPSPHFIPTLCEGFCLTCNTRTMPCCRSGLCWRGISQNNRGNWIRRTQERQNKDNVLERGRRTVDIIWVQMCLKAHVW